LAPGPEADCASWEGMVVECAIAAGSKGHEERALEALFLSGSDVYRVCYKCGLVRPRDTSTFYVAGIGVGG